jgi:hypothetical protein
VVWREARRRSPQARRRDRRAAGGPAKTRDCWFIRLNSLTRTCDSRGRGSILAARRGRPPTRRLPKALAPGEAWETWIEVEKLPEEVRDRAHELARICLASGTVIRPQRST